MSKPLLAASSALQCGLPCQSAQSGAMQPKTLIHMTPVAIAGSLLLAGIACGVGTAHAQQAGTTSSAQSKTAQDKDLPAVLVTATRGERTLREVPASAQVVDAQEVEERQIDDIRELAETIPNVSVERRSNHMTINSSNGRSGNASFNIRGLQGNRVLMLVDGVRMPRNYSFGASSRDNVDFGLIERVEVIKGPSSALYGSDGIGGAVQFFTRTPASYLQGGKTLGGQAGIGYEGNSRSVRTGATVAGQASEQVQWLISGSAMQGHALKNRGDDYSASTTRTAPNPEDTRDTALLGKLVWQPSAAQKHTFAAEYVDKRDELELLSQTGSTTRGVTIASAAGETDNQRRRISWQGEFELGAPVADSLRANLAWQRLRSLEHYENSRVNAPSQVRDTLDRETLLQAGVQAEKIIRTGNLGQKLTYGVDSARTQATNLQTGQTPPAGERFPLKRFPDTTETTVGVYLQNEIIGNGWSLIPGLRWDRYRISANQAGFAGNAASQSGSAWSPRLGATFDLGQQWTLYGQWATGFRTPGADQLNRFFENPIGFYMTVPNPDLKPEKARHVELGIKGQGENWQLEAAAFHGRYRDFILDNQRVAGSGQPGDPLVFQAINTGRARISGFEVAGQYRVAGVGGGTLSFPAAFGMARGRNEDSNTPIDTIAPARLSLGMRYAHADWMVRLDMTRRWAKKADDVPTASDPRGAAATPFLPAAATTFDLSGQWRVLRHANGDVRINAAVHNLTNRKYWRWGDVRGLSANLPTIDAYSQPGRTYSLSLVASF